MASKNVLDLPYKLVLIGDPGVGKTSLLHRFSNDEFVDGPTATSVGVDFKTRMLDVNGKMIKLHIWDTAGQEKHSKSFTRAYFRGSAGIIVVYDHTSSETFDSVTLWLSYLQEHGVLNAPVMILGNKSDLMQQRQVLQQCGQQLATAWDAVFMEVSAKTGENVEMALISFAKKIRVLKEHHRSVDYANIDGTSGGIHLNQQHFKPKSKCLTAC